MSTNDSSNMLKQGLQEYVMNALNRLQAVWEDLGIVEVQREERIKKAKDLVEQLMEQMIAEEEDLRESVEERIHEHMSNIQELCKELTLPAYELMEEYLVLQLESHLRQKLQQLRAKKAERLSVLQELEHQQAMLTKALCVSSHPKPAGSVPTEDELNTLRHYVDGLELQKNSNYKVFVAYKEQIEAYFQILGVGPETEFEREVIFNNEKLCLSDDRLLKVEELLKEVVVSLKKEKSEATCQRLRSELEAMWNLLQVPENERNEFAAKTQSYQKSVEEALTSELKRLAQVRKDNIKWLIIPVRNEIEDYWGKSYYGQEQRMAFSPFYNDEYTEDLLVEHERELERMKGYYDQYCKLFSHVAKWQQSWKMFLEFERKAADPNRFANRGGNLLKEEKERAKLQKMLPKLEEELAMQIGEWEEAQGCKFLVDGCNFLAYISMQHERNKEREKQERQLRKDKSEDVNNTTRTAQKRPFIGTPLVSKIRKLNPTPTGTTPTLADPTARKPYLSATRAQAKPRLGSQSQRPLQKDQNKENAIAP
ncbi:protein regulator of cytokinesis 1-like [Lethenteron reissneri]|uniref:protein regulator of cytokinesis 1-like n=1 Tax=Lethenteron reissneri TaxID=7753 RepID=UPI002AB5E790|nr:protein regulator of cytokinesis 1-like [Lethenteron reissneri]